MYDAFAGQLSASISDPDKLRMALEADAASEYDGESIVWNYGRMLWSFRPFNSGKLCTIKCLLGSIIH